MPCAICLRLRSGYLLIEAAHTKTLGPKGLGQKTSDFSAIPLCFWHHRGNHDSYHHLGEERFAEKHGVNLLELVLALNELYQGNHGTEAVGPTATRLKHESGRHDWIESNFDDGGGCEDRWKWSGESRRGG